MRERQAYALCHAIDGGLRPVLRTRPDSGSPHLILVHRPACSLSAFFSAPIAVTRLAFRYPLRLYPAGVES